MLHICGEGICDRLTPYLGPIKLSRLGPLLNTEVGGDSRHLLTLNVWAVEWISGVSLILALPLWG
jgi:hypothetical protein